MSEHSELSMDMNRRDFLKGTALVGGAATLFGLAGCAAGAGGGTDGGGGTGDQMSSPGAGAESGEGAASTGYSWEMPPTPIPDDQISETFDSDFVVVGAGIAGMVAACRAAELGSVQVLEKASFVGPIREGGWAYNCQLQKDAGIEFTEDDKNGVIERFLKICQNVQVKGENLVHFADNSAPFYDWIAPLLIADGIDVHVDTLYGPYGISLGRSGYPQNDDYQASLRGYAEQKGAVIHFETPGKQLIQDTEGRVIGVIAQNAAGEYLRFNASKGVLISTGGINHNPELMERFYPRAQYIASLEQALPSNTGDGNIMCLQIGADHDELLWGDMLEVSAQGGSDPETVLGLNMVCVGSLPLLWVNTNGERCMNEGGNQLVPEGVAYMAEMNSTNGILAQPEGIVWSIWDSAWEEKLADVTDQGNSFGLWGKASDPDYPGLPSPFGYNTRDKLAQQLENGITLQANSIEELAAKMEVPTDVFKKTVDRYNANCGAGIDRDFFKDSKWLIGIDAPPYYAAKLGSSMFATRGGVKVNYRSQVLDKAGSPIPGLYAAGVISGNIVGYYSLMTSLAPTQVGAYIAVQDAFGQEVR
jgi:hypothetical protein